MSDTGKSESVGEWVNGPEVVASGARCSAAVLGGEFQRRPGACCFRSHRQAAGRRLNSQAWTPALRESPTNRRCAGGASYAVQFPHPCLIGVSSVATQSSGPLRNLCHLRTTVSSLPSFPSVHFSTAKWAEFGPIRLDPTFEIFCESQGGSVATDETQRG